MSDSYSSVECVQRIQILRIKKTRFSGGENRVKTIRSETLRSISTLNILLGRSLQRPGL
jgi:hypothetical protein